MSGIDVTLTQQEERACQRRHIQQERINREEARKQEAAVGDEDESNSSSDNHENDGDDEDDFELEIPIYYQKQLTDTESVDRWVKLIMHYSLIAEQCKVNW